ncbi:MAG: hypothetical protein D8M52_01490 [Chlorobi bacterium]|nr:hypothetical protein [Chlorobiota bacterium]
MQTGAESETHTARAALCVQALERMADFTCDRRYPNAAKRQMMALRSEVLTAPKGHTESVFLLMLSVG